MGAAILRHFESHMTCKSHHVTGKMSNASQVVFVGADKKPSLLHDTKNVPTIKDGEVLAKIRLATICGSDLHTILGKRQEATPRYVKNSTFSCISFRGL